MKNVNDYLVLAEAEATVVTTLPPEIPSADAEMQPTQDALLLARRAIHTGLATAYGLMAVAAALRDA